MSDWEELEPPIRSKGPKVPSFKIGYAAGVYISMNKAATTMLTMGGKRKVMIKINKDHDKIRIINNGEEGKFTVVVGNKGAGRLSLGYLGLPYNKERRPCELVEHEVIGMNPPAVVLPLPRWATPKHVKVAAA